MSTLIKRYFFFILGLIINSFGVAFITKSALGTSQISSIPYVLSLKFTNLSFGQKGFSPDPVSAGSGQHPVQLLY